MMSISIVAVGLSAVLAMVLGFIWYSMPVFGKVWMKETGITEEQVGKGPGMGYMFAVVASAVMAIAMTQVIKFVGVSNLTDALGWGALVAVGFIGTTFGTSFIFEQKTLRHYLIDAGYQMVLAVIVAAVVFLVK